MNGEVPLPGYSVRSFVDPFCSELCKPNENHSKSQLFKISGNCPKYIQQMKKSLFKKVY